MFDVWEWYLCYKSQHSNANAEGRYGLRRKMCHAVYRPYLMHLMLSEIIHRVSQRRIHALWYVWRILVQIKQKNYFCAALLSKACVKLLSTVRNSQARAFVSFCSIHFQHFFLWKLTSKATKFVACAKFLGNRILVCYILDCKFWPQRMVFTQDKLSLEVRSQFRLSSIFGHTFICIAVYRIPACMRTKKTCCGKCLCV